MRLASDGEIASIRLCNNLSFSIIGRVFSRSPPMAIDSPSRSGKSHTSSSKLRGIVYSFWKGYCSAYLREIALSFSTAFRGAMFLIEMRR